MSNSKSTTKRNKKLRVEPVEPRDRELSVKQLNAVDLLVVGKTDQEVGNMVGVHRVTVSKWRLYDPVFQAALNDRRAQIWNGTADQMSALLPKAIEILTKELENEESPQRFQIAMALVKLAGISKPTIGPTRKEEIVRSLALSRREEEKERRLQRHLAKEGETERTIEDVEDDIYQEATWIKNIEQGSEQLDE